MKGSLFPILFAMPLPERRILSFVAFRLLYKDLNKWSRTLKLPEIFFLNLLQWLLSYSFASSVFPLNFSINIFLEQKKKSSFI